MVARAYTTTITASDSWEQVGLEVASLPAQVVDRYSLDDLLGSLDLHPEYVTDFGDVDQAREMLIGHFAQVPELAELVGIAFEEPLVIVEESPGAARALSAVAGAGAIATGFAVFGPWAIVAVPVGVFLLAAAPEAGGGLGRWVGRWFDRRADGGSHPEGQ